MRMSLHIVDPEVREVVDEDENFVIAPVDTMVSTLNDYQNSDMENFLQKEKNQRKSIIAERASESSRLLVDRQGGF